MLQKRWIDPDQHKPRSKGGQHTKRGSVRTRPGSDTNIKAKKPVHPHSFILLFHLLLRSLFFSLVFSRFLKAMNPNPNSLKSTQKCVNHGSIVWYCCAEHESVVESFIHSLNQRGSWFLFHGFRTFLGSISWF